MVFANREANAIRQIAQANKQSLAAAADSTEAIETWHAQSTAQSLDELRSDTSEGALRPPDFGLIGMLMNRCHAARLRRQPVTTRKQDRSNWRVWATTTALLGADAIRKNVSASTGADLLGYRREIALTQMVFMFWVIMSPQFKPSSMLARLRGVSRVHKKSLNLPFVSLSSVVDLCKGVVQEHIDENGPESLEIARKEPLQNWMLVAWMTLMHGIKIGKVTVGVNVAWQGVRVLICLLASTGGRKADVALDDGVQFGMRHLSLWHACWEIGGIRTRTPSDELLNTLDSSSLLHLQHVPCKNDPDGSRWMSSPTTVRWHPTAPVNLPRELAEYIKMRKVHREDFRKTPMLLNPDGKPWRKGALASFFHLMCLAIMSAEQAKLYTIHSFRIYLACALMAAGASAEVIKKLLRWASDEALHIYARMNADAIAEWIEASRAAGISSVRTSSLPSGQVLESNAPIGVAPTNIDREFMIRTGPSGASVADRDRILRGVAAVDIPNGLTTDMQTSARYLDVIGNVDTMSIRPEDRPVVDNDSVIAAIRRDLPNLDREAQRSEADEFADYETYQPQEAGGSSESDDGN